MIFSISKRNPQRQLIEVRYKYLKDFFIDNWEKGKVPLAAIGKALCYQ
jgi:hypothetical protein